MLYLQSQLGQSELDYWAKGSHIQNISIADLKKVRIPKLAKEKQQEIAGNYQKLAQAIKETQETLMVLQQSMRQLLAGAGK